MHYYTEQMNLFVNSSLLFKVHGFPFWLHGFNNKLFIFSLLNFQVVRNVEKVIAIELLAACQAIEFLRPLKTTAPLEEVYRVVRSVVRLISSFYFTVHHHVLNLKEFLMEQSVIR